MILPITLSFAAAATVMNVWLAARVVRDRFALKTLHGDGGHAPLHRRIRAHANFVENTPFALILMALVELAIGSPSWLWLLAVIYIVARILHAFGMDLDRPNPLRAGGMIITMLCLLTLAGTAVVAAYKAQTPTVVDINSANV